MISSRGWRSYSKPWRRVTSMKIAMRLGDDRNWKSLHCAWIFCPSGADSLYDRSLEDIGTRALTLSEKGKIARVLDKTRDLGEVIALVERLRQAILIYQVSARDSQSRRLLTPGTDVSTTVDIQPGRPFDCKFLSPVFNFETELMIGRVKSSFDALLKLHQVRRLVRDQRPRITPFTEIAGQ